MSQEDDKTARLRKTKQFKEIRKNLVEQLERKGAATPCFLGLVDDYMSMWTAKELLAEDIGERGAYVVNDAGQCRKNDSVSDFVKTNAQMLKLLSELGVKADTVAERQDEL